ncbi:imm11 family protein [Vibrio maritimus]|uniref:imm11 family protein n=1 Tax=Vibrio maritimus TaxID=990268 RepID=UPI0040678214
MIEHKVYFSLITEEHSSSVVNFTPIDIREVLYSTKTYHPTSSISTIVWQDSEGGSVKDVDHIVDCGDLSVSIDFANRLMSFDPFGVEFYPSKLILQDGEVKGRYIIAINNVIDVIDEVRSEIEVSPRSGKKLVHELYISSDKLSKIPREKRVAFSVKGAETAIFFCEELFDVISNEAMFEKLRKVKLDTANEAPKY